MYVIIYCETYRGLAGFFATGNPIRLNIGTRQGFDTTAKLKAVGHRPYWRFNWHNVLGTNEELMRFMYAHYQLYWECLEAIVAMNPLYFRQNKYAYVFLSYLARGRLGNPCAPAPILQRVWSIQIRKPWGPFTMRFLDELPKCGRVERFDMHYCWLCCNINMPYKYRRKWNNIQRRCHNMHCNAAAAPPSSRVYCQGLMNLHPATGAPTRFCVNLMQRQAMYRDAAGALTLHCCNRPGVLSKYCFLVISNPSENDSEVHCLTPHHADRQRPPQSIWGGIPSRGRTMVTARPVDFAVNFQRT